MQVQALLGHVRVHTAHGSHHRPRCSSIHRYDVGPYGQAFYAGLCLDLKQCGPLIGDARIKIKDEMDATFISRRSCREGINGEKGLASLLYIEPDAAAIEIKPLPHSYWKASSRQVHEAVVVAEGREGKRGQ